MKNTRLWHLAILVGVVIHIAGAVASVPTATSMLDFGAQYVAAWAVRSGHSMYDWASATQAAASAGVSIAHSVTGYGVEYFPFFICLLVPLTLLPYNIAQAIWFGLLLVALWWSIRLLSGLFRRPQLTMLLAVVAFSPISYGLAFGNVSPLLLLGILALARSLVSDKPRWLYLIPFTLVASIKLFPVTWAFIPIANRRWNCLMKIAVLAIILVLATTAVCPALVADFFNMMAGSDSPITGRRSTFANLQLNILGLVTHLTQPRVLNYERSGISVRGKEIHALIPLSPKTADIVGWALSATVFVILLITCFRMARRGKPCKSLWVLGTGLLIVLPYTLYHSLSILLPALLYLGLSSDIRSRWLSAAAYVMIGVARFSGPLTAVFPASLFVVATHFGTVATVLILTGLLSFDRGDTSQSSSLCP